MRSCSYSLVVVEVGDVGGDEDSDTASIPARELAVLVRRLRTGRWQGRRGRVVDVPVAAAVGTVVTMVGRDMMDMIVMMMLFVQNVLGKKGSLSFFCKCVSRDGFSVEKDFVRCPPSNSFLFSLYLEFSWREVC